MTEVNTVWGSLAALLLVVAIVGAMIVWGALRSAYLSDLAMRRQFRLMIPPEQQRLHMPAVSLVKCRGCTNQVSRDKMTALGFCPDCTNLLVAGKVWPCRRCCKVVSRDELRHGECGDCRDADTTGE